MTSAILSFKLGPVQPFIESARTMRDLWSGSYLLSWLAAHAMKPLIQADNVEFITPDTSLREGSLLKAVITGEKRGRNATLPSLPHTFAAMVPAEKAEELRQAVLQSVHSEWQNIAQAVQAALDQKFRKFDPKWAEFWKAQVESYFDFTVVVLPLADATQERMNEFGIPEDSSQQTDKDKLFGRQWNLMGALLDMSRSVRHVPNYWPHSEEGRFPVKCSLFGTYEQMGPPNFGESRAFWNSVTTAWEGIKGTRLQENDKFCAIALIKRFAWPVYWSDKLGLPVKQLRFTDTATMAGSEWLADSKPKGTSSGLRLDPEKIRDDYNEWNGQWLHWNNPKGRANADLKDDPERKDDPPCPDEVWSLIQQKKKIQGKPPTYYALLMLDGDNMGKVFQGDDGKQFGNGLIRFQEITKRLTTFGDKVQQIVEKKYNGELIYSGGDDVLAFLPTTQVVACAREIRQAFGEQITGASLSGGIAVVHYKEDLRYALEQVRLAERAAKDISKRAIDPSKKDALAIAICKRSGEHANVVLGWQQTEHVEQLLQKFIAGASDRWAYKLREELPILEGLSLNIAQNEILRLVNRGEYGTVSKDEFKNVISNLFDAYKNEMEHNSRNWSESRILEGFVRLCQSASFLARGRD